MVRKWLWVTACTHGQGDYDYACTHGQGVIEKGTSRAFLRHMLNPEICKILYKSWLNLGLTFFIHPVYELMRLRMRYSIGPSKHW